MATEYMTCQIKVSEIIANRIFQPTKSRHPKSPRTFYVAEREDKILCLWCGNLKKSDRVLLPLCNPHQGFTSQQWDTMTTILQRYLKAE
jgi:hypothetical protein